jgi:ABC-type transport system involved in cytochrome c biogenesis permease subunit
MHYIVLLLMAVMLNLSADVMQQAPVAYKGRFRPVEAYSRLWLYDYYHHEKLLDKHLSEFNASDGSADALIWKMHFLGHAAYKDSPLFWVGNKEIKALLGLPEKQIHYSYNQLYHAIYDDPKSSIEVLNPLILHHFKMEYQDPSHRALSHKLELASIAPGFWVSIKDGKILVEEVPNISPWNHFKTGMVLASDGDDFLKKDLRKSQQFSDDLSQLFVALTQFSQLRSSSEKQESSLDIALGQLKQKGMNSTEIAFLLDSQFPLAQRLKNADELFKMLPSNKGNGIWLPLKALKVQVYDQKKGLLVPISNFTLYSDEQFENIRRGYIGLERAFVNGETDDQITVKMLQLANYLNLSYQTIAGKPYLEAMEKSISYPSSGQLYAEYLYYRYPFNVWLIGLYVIALTILLMTLGIDLKVKWAVFGLLMAFSAHTALLILRCYILQRPPVSNMFETVVYVPWIAVLTGFGLYAFLRNQLVLIASSLVALFLLLILQITKMGSGLDNVQAVLDSQYWLIIHVLMVVGSYGAFALCGVLGHFYLAYRAIQKKETASAQFIGKCILQSMYVGLILLIPGTVLGGVWAAESWGRFWDWDPKESWAFISICVYLIWVHAYRFHHIRFLGLAVGSIVGLMAISFTWYGVNYILGTGLHSYGFGTGGEIYYYLYLLAESVFLGMTLSYIQRRDSGVVLPK